MMRIADYMERRTQGHSDGLKTGFVDLDNLVCGFYPNELIVLSSLRGMGKTVFALNIAEHVAVTNKATVLYVCPEISDCELGLRLICSRAKLDSYKLRRNMLTDEERRCYIDVANELTRAPLYIDASPVQTISEIVKKVKRLKRTDDLKLLVIDSLSHIVLDDDIEPKQEQSAIIIQRLKKLAMELRIPVLCLTQLRRSTEDVSRKYVKFRPLLADTRESKAIAEEADVVLLLHREDIGMSREQAEDMNVANKAELIVVKNRYGPTDDITLIWRGEWTRFSNVTEHHETLEDCDDYAKNVAF